jgi:hypothetical protein
MPRDPVLGLVVIQRGFVAGNCTRGFTTQHAPISSRHGFVGAHVVLSPWYTPPPPMHASRFPIVQ